MELTEMMSYWRLTRIGLLAAALGGYAVAGTYAQERGPGPDEPGARSDGSLVYAFMNDSNSVAVIDLASGNVLDRLSVEGDPHGGTITPDGRFIYAASMGSERVNVVDARSGKTVETIEVGGISHHAAVSPDGRYVYVAAEQVVMIDTASNEVVARIATEEPPFILEFTPDGRLLYALSIGTSVAVIDPSRNEVVDTIRMPALSVMGHLAFRPDGKELYVTNDADDMVTIIDAEKNRPVARIPVGKGPHGVATTADGRFVVVANRGGTTLSVIDTEGREVVTTREVGERPEHVTGTPEGDVLLVSVNTGSNKILMLDPASLETLAEIDVWNAPHTLVVWQGTRSLKDDWDFEAQGGACVGPRSGFRLRLPVVPVLDDGCPGSGAPAAPRPPHAVPRRRRF
jgi:YVTN family beta-propeller protein